MNLPPLLIESLQILLAKRTMLIESVDDIETIVVGSSHGDFGFNPAYFPKSFNLCCRSQDLKHSFYLYEKVTATCRNLKNLVVFYSTFSSSSVLEKSPSEKYICPALNEIFQLGLHYEDPELENLCALIQGQLDNATATAEGIGGFLPTTSKGFFADSYGVQRKVSEHLRFSNGHEGDFYLLKLILLAKFMRHNLIIVIPPARSDYASETKSQHPKIFEELKKLSNSYFLEIKPQVLDLFEDDRFTAEDFGDFDHLNPLGEGSQKLTLLIRDLVSQDQIE